MPGVVPQEEPKKVSWFELFFDLIFVVAVAGLTSRLAEYYDFNGLLSFAFLFLILWWLWLGNSFNASRFYTDRPDQRLVGFVQIVAVVFIAYGAGDAFGNRAWAFAGGVGAFKILLMINYLREIGRPGLRRLVNLYAALYALQSALWLLSIVVDPSVRVWMWALALGVDVVTPFIVASETHRAPPHPEHLPERFGLFTLIMLGEMVAASVHALDHGTELHLDTLVAALLGVAIGLLYWIGYFRSADAIGERRVRDAASGRRLRLWAYGHIPLYLGIGGSGAGIVYLSHHFELTGPAPWMFAGSIVAAMLGLGLIRRASVREAE
ncbi:MAG: hypothetical protein RLZZ444_91 [Pseudomonadota bacterium]|jgi:low temperature requirement protein LtrA